MKPIGESSGWIKVACLGLGVALLFHLIGFSTTAWTTYSDYFDFEQGLWKICTLGACQSFYDVALWFHIVRALESIGLILLILSTALTLANILLVTNKAFKRIATYCVPLAGLSIIIGCVYYVIEVFDVISSLGNLGYSYFLCVIAGSIAMVTPLFLSLDARAAERPADDSNKSEYPRGPYPGQVLSPPHGQQPQQLSSVQASGQPPQQWSDGQTSGQQQQQWSGGQASGQQPQQWSGGQASGQKPQQWSGGQASGQPTQQWSSGQDSGQQPQKWSSGQDSGQPPQQWSGVQASGQQPQQWSGGQPMQQWSSGQDSGQQPQQWSSGQDSGHQSQITVEQAPPE